MAFSRHYLNHSRSRVNDHQQYKKGMRGSELAMLFRREEEKLLGETSQHSSATFSNPAANSFTESAPVAKSKAVSPIVAFLASVGVVERALAQYCVNYDNGQPVMKMSGDYLYFDRKGKAEDAMKSLSERFNITTELVYGPGHRKHGQKVKTKLVALPQYSFA